MRQLDMEAVTKKIKRSVRRSTCEKNREAYQEVESVVVDTRPGHRGNIIGVLRDGKWRLPRLAPGDSALPKVTLPRVRVS